jgi:hypothetical protein
MSKNPNTNNKNIGENASDESKPAQINEEVIKTLFQKAASDPHWWYGNAESFKHAANELKKIETEKETSRPPPLGGIITFLQGMAVENLIKAILISLRPERFVISKRCNKKFELSNELITHKLRKLVDTANTLQSRIISLKGKPERQDLLFKLTAALIWGKYGLPKTQDEYEQVINKELYPIVSEKGGYPLTEKEMRECEAFFDDLMHVFDSLQ